MPCSTQSRRRPRGCGADCSTRRSGRVLRDIVEIGQRMIEWTHAALRSSRARRPTAPAAVATRHGRRRDRQHVGRRRPAQLRTSTPTRSATTATTCTGSPTTADGGAYNKDDTHQSLYKSAELLAAQLRAQQAREPGRQIDLIAHSQGGVVVDIFLKLIYDPSDPVVSAARHGGEPRVAAPGRAARAERPACTVRDSTHASGVLDVIDGAGPCPPSDSTAVRQLDPGLGPDAATAADAAARQRALHLDRRHRRRRRAREPHPSRRRDGSGRGSRRP